MSIRDIIKENKMTTHWDPIKLRFKRKFRWLTYDSDGWFLWERKPKFYFSTEIFVGKDYAYVRTVELDGLPKVNGLPPEKCIWKLR